MVAEVEEPPAGDNRIARELAALAMLALSAFAIVSLASFHLGRRPNLCGPVGETLAAALSGLIGFDAYLLVILAVALAIRVWSGPGWKALAREIGGGGLVLVAIASAIGLWSSADAAFAG